MSRIAQPPRPHGRSGVLYAAIAAAAVLLATFSGCADDSPTPATPGSGSQVDIGSDVDNLTNGGGDGTDTVLPRSTSPGATDAPNPNAAGGGAGAATTAP